MLQFILDPGTYLHQFVTVHQQLAMIPHPGVWYPDTREPSFHQQLQYVFCVSTICFLLPHVTDHHRNANGWFMHQPLVKASKLTEEISMIGRMDDGGIVNDPFVL